VIPSVLAVLRLMTISNLIARFRAAQNAIDMGRGATKGGLSRITHFEGQVIALFDGLPAGTSRAL
jgi:hypothetical protein